MWEGGNSLKTILYSADFSCNYRIIGFDAEFFTQSVFELHWKYRGIEFGAELSKSIFELLWKYRRISFGAEVSKSIFELHWKYRIIGFGAELY